ncbi:MAG: DUF6719 family protein [Pseudomonadota bacterium]
MQHFTHATGLTAWSLTAALALSGCETPDIFNEEPPIGAMKVGEVILVDDNSCPVGQIKEVHAGNRRLAKPRERRCIDW